MDSNNSGRPTDLTPALHQKIILLVGGGGVPPEIAAKQCGVKRSTFFSWRARGRRERSGLYHDFEADLMIAEGTDEVDLWYSVRTDARTKVASAKWLLKERHGKKRRSGVRRKKERPAAGDAAAAIRDALREMDASGPPPASPETCPPLDATHEA